MNILIRKATVVILGFVMGIVLFSCNDNQLLVYISDDIILEDEVFDVFKKNYIADETEQLKFAFFTYPGKKKLEQGILDAEERLPFETKRLLKKIDIFISSDMRLTRKLKALGYFDSLDGEQDKAEIVSLVNENMYDEDSLWLGLSAKALFLVYNSARGDRILETSSYERIEDWGKTPYKLAFPAAESNYILTELIAFLIYEFGEEWTREWMERIDSLLVDTVGDDMQTQVRYLDYNGADYALVDGKSIREMQQSVDSFDESIVQRLKIIFARPAFLHLNTVSIMKKTNYPAETREFLRFLLSKEVQEEISIWNWDYPTAKSAIQSAFLASFGASPELSWESVEDYLKFLPQAERLTSEFKW